MRKSFVRIAALLAGVLLASPLLAKPGVVTNLQGQTFGGDVTEGDTNVYIDTPTGKLTMSKTVVATITYATAPAAPAVPAPTPQADASKSPEEIFKDKGLIKTGFMLIFPEEAALHESVNVLRSTKGKLAAAAAKIRDSDFQIKAIDRHLRGLRDEDHDINARVAKGEKDNQLISRHNLLLDEIRKTLDQLDQADQARQKLVMSRSDYITATLNASDKADAAVHAYDAPAADQDLIAAIEKYNLTAKPKVKLGPSVGFNEDLALVKLCKADVSSGVIPITPEGGVPNVDVLINGTLTQRMTWDSGCSGVTLSAKTAKALGLHASANDPIEEHIIADGSKIKVHVVTLDSIRIGPYTVEDIKCTLPSEGTEGTDLLGTTFQSCFQFKLDMANQTLGLIPLLEKKKTKTVDATGQKVVNLLEGISLADQSVYGTWQKRDGALCSDLSEGARFDFNYRPPTEYDYRITFTKLDGNDALGMFLCARGRQFRWDMGGWGNSICGIDETCAKRADNNPTRVNGHPLQAGKTVECIVKVRSGQLSVYMDRQRVAQWETDYRDLGTADAKLHRVDTLGLFTWHTSYAISKAEVVEISGTGEKVAKNDRLAAKKLATAIYVLPDESRVVTLYDNGHFQSADNQDNVWFLRGDSLCFRWGGSVDECTLSADRKSFTGHGANNTPIHGEVITGSIVADKAAPATLAQLHGLPPAIAKNLAHDAPPGGAVLYLPFDKTDSADEVHDRSSNHLVFPAHDVDEYPEAVTGAHGTAEFDGRSWIDAKSFGKFPAGEAFSIAVWMKAAEQGNGPLIDQSDWENGGKRGFALRLVGRTCQFSRASDDWHHLSSSTPLGDDLWHHVAVVSTGGVTRMYLDGVEDASDRMQGAVRTSPYALNIGRGTYDQGRVFQGSLAELMLFNRALSADEVAKLAGLKK